MVKRDLNAKDGMVAQNAKVGIEELKCQGRYRGTSMPRMVQRLLKCQR